MDDGVRELAHEGVAEDALVVAWREAERAIDCGEAHEHVARVGRYGAVDLGGLESPRSLACVLEHACVADHERDWYGGCDWAACAA